MIPIKTREWMDKVKICALRAIADEPEYPSEMPDELWKALNGDRDATVEALRSTVRLTKNGITERFLISVIDLVQGGLSDTSR